MLHSSSVVKATHREPESERQTVDYNDFAFLKQPDYYWLILSNAFLAFIYHFTRYWKCINRKAYRKAVWPMPFPEKDIVKPLERPLTPNEKKHVQHEAFIFFAYGCVSPALMFWGWGKWMGYVLMLFAGLAPFTLFFVYFLVKWNPYKSDLPEF